MAKYIIDIPEDRIGDFVGSTHLLMPYTMAGHMGHHDTGLELTLYTEPDRKTIEDEVWEFVRIITDMTEKQRIECFGGASCDLDEYLTYRDAKAKYEEWRKRKDEIHEYDEIISEVPDNKAIIVCIDIWGQWHCINADGSFMVEINQQGYWKKTGRSFPELGDVLKKMREE